MKMTTGSCDLLFLDRNARPEAESDDCFDRLNCFRIEMPGPKTEMTTVSSVCTGSDDGFERFYGFRIEMPGPNPKMMRVSSV